MQPKLTEKERLELIQRVTQGHEKVARVCREKGISRVLFYRWLRRYLKSDFKEKSLAPQTGDLSSKPAVRPFSAQDRLEMIQRVADGEPVAKVCRDYGVSRVIFYLWQKRYQEAPEGQKLEALSARKPQVSKFYRQAPPEVEKAVLSVVVQHPELSSHKIVELLPQVGGRPVLGNHGVQNVLRRHNLTTFANRQVFARATRHVSAPIDRFLHLFQTLLGWLLALPSERRHLTLRLSAGFLVGFFTGIVWFGIQSYLGMMSQAPLDNKIGLFFASIALTAGSFFFLYSFKYYATLAIVLGFSRHAGESNSASSGYQGGLQPNLDQIKLERTPFVSIHLPMYNEKKVVDRLLTACTSMSYEDYEVIVVDDSTDETTEILKDWQNHPRVKIVHRDSRAGFKGGALQVAFQKSDPRAEFILVFDADFVPYPDTITQFLKYFQSVAGSLDFRLSVLGYQLSDASQPVNQLTGQPITGKLETENGQLKTDNRIAAVQGYQWHVLNKSENWITRGVRSEYAGSYVVERSGAEVLGALKQIAGSVYMIRKDILDKFGWQTSITEDFQLTLRLYEAGYKVVYTPYIQAPSECVSTIRRLVRQRMRWAEGHSYNVRKNFVQILFSSQMTLMEKIEFLYLSPYYLQSAFFLIGTLAWFLSEAVFQARLPFWTALWGWSLVLTNMFALPLMNTVGLFLEESEERDYLGALSFMVISYLLVPFQAYASVKGFLEKEEGPWFRTPKTGKITDIFTRGRFYRWLSGILPGKAGAPALSTISIEQSRNHYLALATANNQFNGFQVKPKRLRWLSKAVLAILLAFTVTLYSLSRGVVEVQATVTVDVFYLHDGNPQASQVITSVTAWQLKDSVDTTNSTTTAVSVAKTGGTPRAQRYTPGSSNSAAVSGTTCTNANLAPNGQGWILDTVFGSDGSINAGTWTFYVSEIDTNAAAVGYILACPYKVTISGGGIATYNLLDESGVDTTGITIGVDTWDNAGANDISGSKSLDAVTFTGSEYLYVEFWNIYTTRPGAAATSTLRTGPTYSNPRIDTPAGTIPEKVLLLGAAAPLIPLLVLWMKKRRLDFNPAIS